MKLTDISLNECKEKCRNGTLSLAIGPFNFSISSTLNDVQINLYKLYASFPLLPDDSLIDFTVKVDKPKGIRRWYRPQVFFYLDEQSPFLPLPASQAFPLLEWGMNWCIGRHSHQFLMIHAAVLEKDGIAIILPADSGSGKSTLTALLSLNGWRLLSDEMALIDHSTLKVQALCRPTSLKNQSIEVVQSIANEQAHNITYSDIVNDTNKGTICHLKPEEEHVFQVANSVTATHVIFPKYTARKDELIEEVDQGIAMMQVIENSFNYNILGKTGFDTLCRLMNQVNCYNYRYSNNQAALSFFDQLK